MIPGRLESCTVKLGKLRKNLNQGRIYVRLRMDQSFVIKMKYWHDGMNILMNSSTKIITRNMPLQKMEIHGP